MADGKRRNVLVGVFVLGALVCMGILIVKFGETSTWFGKRYVVIARFDRVTGVREGTEVQLAGVYVGNVNRINLSHPDHPNEGVLVYMEIQREYSIPQGSVANILVPLMGQTMINIMPPAAVIGALPKDNTAMIAGTVVNPLEQIIDPKFIATLDRTTRQMGDLAQALTPAANAITDLLKERSIKEVESPEAMAKNLTANLYTAVERLYTVLTHIDQVIGDPANQSNLKDAIANIKAVSVEARAAAEGFRKFSEDARGLTVDAHVVIGKMDSTVDDTHKQINDLARRLQANTDQLSKLLEYFVSAGKDIAQGQGTIGMFLRDPRFYEEMLLTVQRLSAAASDLQTTVNQWKAGGLPVKLR
jgi:phospholipid/cholesterol/gamma-HCH transport system substrate-binding protein